MKRFIFILPFCLFLFMCGNDKIAKDDDDDIVVGPEERSYEFNNGVISRNVLENYLSRSITESEFLNRESFNNDQIYPNKDDDTRMIKNIGAKFIGRSIFSWGAENVFNSSSPFLYNAKQKIQEMHQYDPDMIFQAAIFEIVTTKVNSIPIPSWVFEEYELPIEERNFSYVNMLNQDGQYVDHWGSGASVPDISRLETRMFFYFMARNIWK